jgi:hypothetical protein
VTRKDEVPLQVVQLHPQEGEGLPQVIVELAGELAPLALFGQRQLARQIAESLSSVADLLLEAFVAALQLGIGFEMIEVRTQHLREAADQVALFEQEGAVVSLGRGDV